MSEMQAIKPRVDCPQILLQTDLGDIVVELMAESAPLSVAAFILALNAGDLDSLSFWRSVGPDNDASADPFRALQAGPANLRAEAEGIDHESTRRTGLRHTDGTVSLARGAPGTASPHHFFICIGDNPQLDAGGGRPADGLGFAAFGRVIGGMDVVRRIHLTYTGDRADLPEFAGQVLCPAIPITTIRRLPT
jgi:peptidyl-prolyl cis-trans isomerase A (cyclophilin A)